MVNPVYKALKYSNDLLTELFKDKRKLLLVLITGIVFLLLIKNFKTLFITSVLIIVGALSLIHSRYFKYSHYLGVELCMLATVLTALKYGPVFGFFTGFTSITLGLIISGKFKHSSFVSMLTLPIIGLIVPFFQEYSLLTIGILMTVIYDLIILPIYILMGSRIYTSAIFFSTHLLWNSWIFTAIAPIIYSVM